MIFADSSFWIALNMSRDRHHEAARRLLSAHPGESLLVTNHVLGETWTYLRKKAGHARAIGFADEVSASARVEIMAVPPETEKVAWKWLRKHDERAYSFIDATSFAVMRSLKIREALAFDGDFTAAGFTELRA